MSALQVVTAILLLIACLTIIVLVTMQKGGRGLDSNFGSSASDTYLSQSGKKGLPEYRMARYTKIATVVFFVLAILVGVANLFS